MGDLKFYQDLHTSSMTPDDIAKVLKENPHCAIMQGPTCHIKAMDKKDIRRKVFASKEPISGFNFTCYQFSFKEVPFTRVGICGCEEVTDEKTKKKKTVLRFHRAITDDKLCAVVVLSPLEMLDKEQLPQAKRQKF
jgi:hypothetical protein